MQMRKQQTVSEKEGDDWDASHRASQSGGGGELWSFKKNMIGMNKLSF